MTTPQPLAPLPGLVLDHGLLQRRQSGGHTPFGQGRGGRGALGRDQGHAHSRRGPPELGQHIGGGASRVCGLGQSAPLGLLLLIDDIAWRAVVIRPGGGNGLGDPVPFIGVIEALGHPSEGEALGGLLLAELLLGEALGTKKPGEQLRGPRAQAVLHIVTLHIEISPVAVTAAHDDVGMGMLCITVIGSHPVQRAPEVAFHLGHEQLDVACEIELRVLPHHEHQAELMRVLLRLPRKALTLGGGRPEQGGVLLLRAFLMLEIGEMRARGRGLGPSLEKILPRQRGVEGLEWGFRLFGHPSSA
jgi:hypothetical protein